MKIIFLDIDGVLNNHHSLGLNRYIPTPLILNERVSHHLSPWCMHCLNEIIEKTNAKVVVSSTWRLGETTERLQAILNFYGFKGEVIGRTPYFTFSDSRRGDEIQHYISFDLEEDLESFVIIDDDSDMKHLLKFLVKTDATNGLNKKDVSKCVRVLNNDKFYIVYNYLYQKFRRARGVIVYKFFKKWRY